MIDRDWSDAVKKRDEYLYWTPICQYCKRHDRGFEMAHTIGRQYDEPKEGRKIRYVDPRAIVILCRVCHRDYDANVIGILSILNPDELAWAVSKVGEFTAYRIMGGPRL